jgi:plasmid segregation protein ParM
LPLGCQFIAAIGGARPDCVTAAAPNAVNGDFLPFAPLVELAARRRWFAIALTLTMNSSTRLRAIGIDVGFFATKFTTGRVTDGNSRDAIPTGQFPSVAPFQHVEPMMTAAGPGGDGVRLTVDGVSHYVGQDTLLEAGGWGMTGFADDWSTTTAYKALFRGALYQVARANAVGSDLEIEMLVAGLPMATHAAYHGGLQSFILQPHVLPHPADPKRAMKVRVLRTRVLGQPQGALVNHQLSSGERFRPGQMNLVLDLGGGTFDWFVAQEAKGSRSRSGSAPLGALACASAVCGQLREGWQHSPVIMSRVDEALRTGAESVSISGVSYPLGPFLPSVHAILRNALEQMRRGVGRLDEMDLVLFTGGGGGLLHSVAREHMKDQRRVFAIDADAMLSNVRGFHLWAEHLLAQSEKV